MNIKGFIGIQMRWFYHIVVLTALLTFVACQPSSQRTSSQNQTPELSLHLLNGFSCNNGQTITFDGSAWVCSDPNLTLPDCANGEVPVSNGSGWACQPESQLGTQVVPGYIKGFELEFSSGSEINIPPGVVDIGGGLYNHTTTSALTITSFTGSEGWYYIYADQSASTENSVVFIDSSTEPTYSDTLLGWYNGEDRCIGAVYSEDGSGLDAFTVVGNTYLLNDELQTLANGNPDGSYILVNVTPKVPVFAVEARFNAQNSDTGSSVTVSLRSAAIPSISYTETLADGALVEIAEVNGWLPVTSANRNIEYSGEDDDDNNFAITFSGVRWKL